MAFSYLMNKGCTHGSKSSSLFLPVTINLQTKKKITRLTVTKAALDPSSYVASFAALATFARNVAIVAKEFQIVADIFVPREYQSYYINELQRFLHVSNTEFTVVIDEYQPQSYSPNRLFKAAEIYLGTKVYSSSIQRVNVCTKNKRRLDIIMDEGEEIIDHFDGVRVKWRYSMVEQGKKESRRKSYELTFHERHREKVLNSYFPYILERAEAIEAEESGVKLHIIEDNFERAVTLNHPMTFETLAIDMELKKAIMEDLNNFKNGKEHYRRIGKAWKRGYFIYGPSGTGKSSFIVSIANYLKYDIYNVDLTQVDYDSQLRSILLDMPNNVIIVFEDIDCAANLQNRVAEKTKQEASRTITLSGFLNFMDGIWSCCGEGRIFIFTTNYKDRLDPALLRPGRMDMHIHMSYCKFSAFKQLALNYLEVDEHPLFKQIEELLEKANATPAEVAGELMQNTRDATASLEGLIEFLNKKATAVVPPMDSITEEKQKYI